MIIEDNVIAGVRHSLFDLEPNNNTGEALHVQLLSNQTGAVHNFWLASKGSGSQVGDVTVRGNVMQAPSGGLIWVRAPPTVAPRTGFVIDANTFIARNAVSDEGSAGAFFFQNCGEVTITANRVSFKPEQHMPAVELRGTSRVTVSGNVFDGSSTTVMADAASKEVQQG